jgi:hypothetical protein
MRLDVIGDLVGRRMVVELQDRLENHPALHGAALSALEAHPLEELDPLSPCRRFQVFALPLRHRPIQLR